MTDVKLEDTLTPEFAEKVGDSPPECDNLKILGNFTEPNVGPIVPAGSGRHARSPLISTPADIQMSEGIICLDCKESTGGVCTLHNLVSNMVVAPVPTDEYLSKGQDEIKKGGPFAYQEFGVELLQLARLGLWAREHAIPNLEKYADTPHLFYAAPAKDALDKLPKEET